MSGWRIEGDSGQPCDGEERLPPPPPERRATGAEISPRCHGLLCGADEEQQPPRRYQSGTSFFRSLCVGGASCPEGPPPSISNGRLDQGIKFAPLSLHRIDFSWTTSSAARRRSSPRRGRATSTAWQRRSLRRCSRRVARRRRRRRRLGTARRKAFSRVGWRGQSIAPISGGGVPHLKGGEEEQDRRGGARRKEATAQQRIGRWRTTTATVTTTQTRFTRIRR